MTQPRVQIVDYRLGNLFSIQQACAHVGLDAFVSDSADELQTVDGIVLPGVGAYGNAMQSLNDLQLTEPLQQAAEAGKPLFGICLGMQLLFEGSEEFGEHEGLGLISGKIVRIPDQILNGRQLRVPNVGWNRIEFANGRGGEPVLNGVSDNTFMYFVHSYCAQSVPEADRLTTTMYGEFRYCSAVLRGSILGCQFHPEKSAQAGLRLYENWARSLR
jgi:glutamine amidotransferase